MGHSEMSMSVPLSPESMTTLGHIAKGMKVADGMKVAHQLTSRWESVLDYPMEPRVATRVLRSGGRGKERFGEGARLLALAMEAGDTSHGMQAVTGCRKRKGAGCPRGLQQQPSPVETLILTPRVKFGPLFVRE